MEMYICRKAARVGGVVLGKMRETCLMFHIASKRVICRSFISVTTTTGWASDSMGSSTGVRYTRRRPREFHVGWLLQFGHFCNTLVGVARRAPEGRLSQRLEELQDKAYL